MHVFHGNYLKIENIDLLKCKPNKDFGRGFYVTKFRHHADSWASVIGRLHKTEGFITEFIYLDSLFTEQLCKVKHFDTYNEEWLDFVITNRDPMLPMHDFDIVEGPVANDKIQSRIFEYLKGLVNKQDFLKELIFHENTHQICFCTLKSLLTLKSLDETSTSEFAHVGKLILENLILDNEIDELHAMDLFYNSNTFAQFADENTELYKEPWQGIYEMLKIEIIR